MSDRICPNCGEATYADHTNRLPGKAPAERHYDTDRVMCTAQRAGLGVDHLERAEPGIGHVVIDVDDHRQRFNPTGRLADAADVAAVENDRHVAAGILGKPPDDKIDGRQEPVDGRDRGFAVQCGSFAHRVERQAHRDQGSDRVAIRIGMGRNKNAPAILQLAYDLFHFRF